MNTWSGKHREIQTKTFLISASIPDFWLLVFSLQFSVCQSSILTPAINISLLRSFKFGTSAFCIILTPDF